MITDLPEFFAPHPSEPQWGNEWHNRKKWQNDYHVFRTFKGGMKSVAAAMCGIDMILPIVGQYMIANSTMGLYLQDRLHPIRQWIDGRIEHVVLRAHIESFSYTRFGTRPIEHNAVDAVHTIRHAAMGAMEDIPARVDWATRQHCHAVIRSCSWVWRHYRAGNHTNVVYMTNNYEEEFARRWLGRVEAKFAFADAITCELE